LVEKTGCLAGTSQEIGWEVHLRNVSIVTLNPILNLSSVGDILVNSSTVDYNRDNGVNITYEGGWRIFNRSSFSYNLGNGVNITMNETRTLNNGTVRYARHQRTEVSRSEFILNDGHGVRVGNHCRESSAVVNDSSFVGNQRAAVEFESCYKLIPDANVTNFTVSSRSVCLLSHQIQNCVR